MLSAELLPHQADLVSDDETEVLCCVAGVRSGKTWGACAKTLIMGLTNGDLPMMFVQPTYPMLRDVGVRTFQAVMEAWGIGYDFSKTDMILRPHLGEGFDILLRSADNPQKLMGATLSGAVMDEAGQCREDVAKELLKRVSHPDAVSPQLVLCGTPEGINWFRDWSEDPPEGLHSRLIRARTYDNPHLPPGYLDKILSYLSPDEVQRYVEGLFVPPSGRVYHRFNRDRHALPCPPLKGGQVQMWCDFNIDNQAWCFARVLNGEAHVFGECVGAGDTQTRAEEAVSMLHSMGIQPRNVDVYCDASGSARRTSSTMSDVILLKRAGFKSVRHPAANPAVRDRVAAVNLAFSEDRLFIDPKRAPYHLKCIEMQGRDKHGDPDKSGGLDHGADAVGYGIVNQWPVRVLSSGNAMRYH